MTTSAANIKFNTLVELIDKNTNEVLVSQCNAIHPANMARVIAFGLANSDHNTQPHYIYMVALGNGGTYINSAGTIVYNPPRTTMTNAKLYNQTYPAIANMDTDFSTTVTGANITNSGNFVVATAPTITNTTATGDALVSIVNVSLVLPADLPATQAPTDAGVVTTNDGAIVDPNDPNAILTAGTDYLFDFDELALMAKNPLHTAASGDSEPEYIMLTHLVFNPIAKTQNRELQLNYSLSISCS